MKIFDAHFHIINPDFPLVSNQGYLPPVFTEEAYQSVFKKHQIVGGAIVSGSFQGYDQEYLVHALKKLGSAYCGVANIPLDISESELLRLNEAGVVAVRFNLKRGGIKQLKHLEYLSIKLHQQLSWHTELYLDSKFIPELFPMLKKLPALSIDHLGLSRVGLADLYRLVSIGVKVKASGFGRLDFDPIPVMKKILEINPQSLMFGSDLPSTRAKIPFSEKDIDLVSSNFSRNDQARIFFENAVDWYRVATDKSL